MIRAIEATGIENFNSRKIAAHQKKEDTRTETAEQKEDRLLNEGADKRAVQGALRHAPPDELVKQKKEHKKLIHRLQKMMLAIVDQRNAALDKWALNIAETEGLRKRTFEERRKIAAEERLKQLMEKKPDFKKKVEKLREEKGFQEHIVAAPSDEQIRNLSGPRQKAFPEYWFEPRATKGEPIQNIAQAEYPTSLSRSQWGYASSLFKPLLLYWRSAYVNTDAKVPAHFDNVGASWTPWLLAALDFWYSTAEPIVRTYGSNSSHDHWITTIVRHFVAATKRVFGLCGDPWKIQEHRAVATFQPLGLPKCRGFSGRLVVRSPEKVDQVIHDFADRVALGTLKATWNQTLDIPDVSVSVPVHFGQVDNASQSSTTSATGTDVGTSGTYSYGGSSSSRDQASQQEKPPGPQKRLHGKQSLAPTQENLQDIVLPKERKNEKPKASTLIQALQLDDTEKARLEAIGPILQNREKKRLLHNKTWVQGQHRYEEITSDSPILRCSICSKDVDCSKKDLNALKHNGVEKISLCWKKVKVMCQGPNAVPQPTDANKGNGTRSINYTAILEKQNRRITAKNEEDFGANPPLHVWSLNNADHIGEAKCRRRNCIFHTNPAKLSI